MVSGEEDMMVDALGGEISELLLLESNVGRSAVRLQSTVHARLCSYLQIKLPVTFLFKDTYSEKIR